MEKWLVAGLWGLLSGSALVMGSLAGYYLNISQKAVAIVMGFGAGVLISALSFELMNEAFKQGGFVAAAGGFLAGSIVYSVANYFVSKKGGKHRKRSGDKQPTSDEDGSLIGWNT
jgi:ZIP family zinc transporter